MGICHSYAPDGRCISLLKILLTNFCVYDCLYCVNRVTSNTPRARFSVAEIVQLTLDLILTPDTSAYWDGESLHFGPGASRTDAPDADALEALWKTYYASIFNPARLKTHTMQAHMPKKYWANLPEAELIPELIAQATRRTAAMIEADATVPQRRIVPHERTAPVVAADDSLEGTRAAAARCHNCPLWEHATQTVFGEGLGGCHPARAPRSAECRVRALRGRYCAGGRSIVESEFDMRRGHFGH